MSAESVRQGTRNQHRPAEHELPPIRVAGETVTVTAAVWRTEDGRWRGCLRFGDSDNDNLFSTAEILCADNESDFWESVRDLNDHHIKDLYRSVSQ